jgi:outer membrane protein OmpA-like peptidoglycan-associated protein
MLASRKIAADNPTSTGGFLTSLNALYSRFIGVFKSSWVIVGALAISAFVGNVSAEETSDTDIMFALNSARLSSTARSQVREIARTVINDASPQVQVIGHSDTSGDAEYNLLLSRRRAQSVVDALRSEGVSEAIIKVDWKGEFEPVMPGPELPKPENRRVTVRIAPSDS